MLKKFLNVNSDVIYTNSGTSALLCALYSLNLPKESIIVGPNYAYPAWFNVSRILGYENIIIGDVSEKLNLSYTHVKGLIDNGCEIKVIFYVHHVGILDEDVMKIKELCVNNGIYLIEDACISLGVYHPRIPVFSIGDISTLSFSGNKFISLKEGGAIIVNNKKLLKRVLELQFQDNYMLNIYNDTFCNDNMNRILHAGLNLKMSELLLPILNKKLEKFEELNEKRNKIFNTLRENLDIICDKDQTSPSKFVLRVKNMTNFKIIKKAYPSLFSTADYKSLSYFNFCCIPQIETSLIYLPLPQKIDMNNIEMYSILKNI